VGFPLQSGLAPAAVNILQTSPSPHRRLPNVKRLCKKQKTAPPPLLVFSPTSVYAKNKIRTTALVGVFTNKRL
jgi:hypothetical protein